MNKSSNFWIIIVFIYQILIESKKQMLLQVFSPSIFKQQRELKNIRLELMAIGLCNSVANEFFINSPKKTYRCWNATCKD